MSPPFLKVVLRQLKTRIFLLFNLFKRLFCCFRGKVDTAEFTEELLVDSNFIVVQQNSSSDQQHQQYGAPAAGSSGVGGFEQDGSLENWDSMSPISVTSGQAFGNTAKSPSFSYSNYSLVNQQQQPQFSTNNIGSRIDIGPNRPNYQLQQGSGLNEPEHEPDFFQDMTPKFRKPKTVYVAKEAEIRHDEISKKFQIDDRKAVELDDSKFKPFGALEDTTSYSQAQHGDQSTSWEDMAEEETAWGDGGLDANLVALRREAREQRQREHQERRFKQQSQFGRKTA